MRKTVVIIIKWLIAIIAALCMRIIKGYFFKSTGDFNQVLIKSGFHPSVVNNPYIVFKNKAAIKIPYNNWLASWLLSGFYLFTKYKCWKKETKCFYLLKLLNMQDAYMNDILLLYYNFTFSPYKEIDVLNGKCEKHNIVIYSVIVGDYDEILDPVYISEGCDYILFTDNANIKSNVWEIRLLPESDLDDVRRARHVKIMAHQYLDKKYDYSIFVDGRTFICGDIKRLVNHLDDDTSIAFIRHNSHQSVKEELELCLECNVFSKVDNPFKQWEFYSNEGFTDNNGAVETGLLIRKHNDEFVEQLMNCWWQQLVLFTPRDQISIMYVLWKDDFRNFKILDGSVWSNQFSIITKHN